MQLRCIKTARTKTGLFGKKPEIFEGLTVNKIYTVYYDNGVHGNYNGFLVFNDFKVWKVYPLEFFAPIG